MSKSALLETRTSHRFDAVLEKVSQGVRLSLPAATCEIHHGQNDDFPWWVAARFTHGEKDAKSVDVSVECQRRDDVVRLRADVARESGYVVSEIPTFERTSARDDESTGSWLEERLKQIEEFLLNQVPTITHELT
jgi:hypothetical protein